MPYLVFFMLLLNSGVFGAPLSPEDMDNVNRLNTIMTANASDYWILHQDLVCATMLDLELSFSIGEEHEDFITNRFVDRYVNVAGHHGLIRHRRAVTHTHTLEPVHSILVFKGRLYDRMPRYERIYETIPHHARECIPTILDNQPKGQSQCLREHADLFTEVYNDLYGSYGLFTNNCHYFTNRLAAFLTVHQCGKRGIPAGHCETDECNLLIQKFREKSCHLTAESNNDQTELSECLALAARQPVKRIRTRRPRLNRIPPNANVRLLGRLG